VIALTEELREAKKQNNTSAVKPNPPAPEDPANHEAIKSLIESILGPALKSLTAPAPQPKRAAKQKQTKAEIPQAPVQEPITVTASTSKDSYSRAVRATPKAKTIEDAQEDIAAARAPEVTPMTTDSETTATEPKPASAETLKPSATSSQEPGFTLSRAERRKNARKAAKEQKQAERVQKEKDAAEKEKRKVEKCKRLPTSIRQDPATILLLPNNATPNVLQRLQNMPEADLQQLGIKRYVVFPSGALLVKCNSQTGTTTEGHHLQCQYLREGRTTKAHEFRIHTIPGCTSKEQLQKDKAALAA